MWRVFIYLTMALFALAGCTSSHYGPIEQPEEALAFSPEDYRIGVGDNLAINVWRDQALSVTVPVRPDGKISMPLIGDVLAADKTAEGLADEITTKLEKYVRNPQVTVIITNPSSTDFQHRVRVTGAVRGPQSIPYRQGMTVLDLVLMAGGPNEFAQPNAAKLYRRVAGEVKVYPIYLRDILERGNLESNYQLLPGDIVTVPDRAF
ncbi:MAG: polysaccharide biosynthesis/export family protein [Spongiibacteraceae bacterium]|jgi:polysaccharide export outer membrane protein|nr:polysaccharide biosynthesis/export family protein [Spongiibacteraceae bacterium]